MQACAHVGAHVRSPVVGSGACTSSKKRRNSEDEAAEETDACKLVRM